MTWNKEIGCQDFSLDSGKVRTLTWRSTQLTHMSPYRPLSGVTGTVLKRVQPMWDGRGRRWGRSHARNLHRRTRQWTCTGNTCMIRLVDHLWLGGRGQRDKGQADWRDPTQHFDTGTYQSGWADKSLRLAQMKISEDWTCRPCGQKCQNSKREVGDGSTDLQERSVAWCVHDA